MLALQQFMFLAVLNVQLMMRIHFFGNPNLYRTLSYERSVFVNIDRCFGITGMNRSGTAQYANV